MAVEFKTDFTQDGNKYSLYCETNDEDTVKNIKDTIEDAKVRFDVWIALMVFGVVLAGVAISEIIGLLCDNKPFSDPAALPVLIAGILLTSISLRNMSKYGKCCETLGKINFIPYEYIKQVQNVSLDPRDVKFSKDDIGYAIAYMKMHINAYLPVKCLEKDSLLNDDVVLVRGSLKGNEYEVKIFVNDKAYDQIINMNLK